MAKGRKICPECGKELGARKVMCECGFLFVESKKVAPKEKKESVGQGKKRCPSCGKIIGARTSLCQCGYHFPSQKMRKDLLEQKKPSDEEGPLEYTEISRGRKKCPFCSKIVGARVSVCSCGFDFIEHRSQIQEQKNKEIEEKRAQKKAEREAIKEQKRVEQKALKAQKKLEKMEERREKVSQIEEEKEKKVQERNQRKAERLVEKIEELYRQLKPYVPPVKLTARDHAERILSYGDKVAGFLLKMKGNKDFKGRWGHVDWEYVAQKLGSENMELDLSAEKDEELEDIVE